MDGIVDLIESTGALAIFLPPILLISILMRKPSPNKKKTLKANEELLEYLDIESLVLHALTSITAEDCKNWISHDGY